MVIFLENLQKASLRVGVNDMWLTIKSFAIVVFSQKIQIGLLKSESIFIQNIFQAFIFLVSKSGSCSRMWYH